jgi:hypothetical protein
LKRKLPLQPKSSKRKRLKKKLKPKLKKPQKRKQAAAKPPAEERLKPKPKQISCRGSNC